MVADTSPVRPAGPSLNRGRTSVPAAVRAYARDPAHHGRWLADLTTLLTFQTVASIPSHRPDIQAAADWLATHLRRIGLHGSRILPGENGGCPSVYAEWLQAPGKPTLLVYGHFDVQPAEPLASWRTPPFRPVTIGDRLVARGANDDKGQVFIALKAIESYLATSVHLPVNIKIWLEGEEEIGSPNLTAVLDRERDRPRADAALVVDTPMAAIDRPTLVFSLRGLLDVEVEVRGAKRELHSGAYGGGVCNPAQTLCHIISALHDAAGRVAIPGFYDEVRPVVSPSHTAVPGAATTGARPARRGRVSACGETGFTASERTLVRPALNLTGIVGGHAGAGRKAIIPSQATAKLNLRLVPDQDPSRIAAALRAYITHLTPPGVQASVRFAAASRPVTVPRRHPALTAAAAAVRRVWGLPPVLTRSGGTIAFVEQIVRRYGIAVVVLGFGPPDGNPHAANEYLHLPTFFRGIETVIELLAEYGR